MVNTGCIAVTLALVMTVAFSLPMGLPAPCSNRPNMLPGNAINPSSNIITGNIITNVGPCAAAGNFDNAQVSPLVTEIVPALQFGDINLAGDLPIGGTIKISGRFPVYGTVAVDGTVPSSGTAVINTGNGFITQVIEPGCGNIF